MPQFAYIGDEAGAFAFGRWFPAGAAVEVPESDAHAVKKMRHSHHFAELFDGVEVLDSQTEAKRRGRPPKAK